MLEISCSGTPFEVGQQHGHAANKQVHGSMAFYERFFMKKASLSWAEVCKVAIKFLPFLEASWPSYVQEMKGVADGAGVDFPSILALNVRTEIAYGMASDGCTAFAWKSKGGSFLGQNWDWENEQSPNIVCLHIEQDSKPRIHMMTEAGILGKIGLNSAGVGCTLNAIQAKGLDFARLPCHLALRAVLESRSREDAVQKLSNPGVASACHITVADAQTGGIGLECSAFDIVQIPMDDTGICTHSNHFVKTHSIEANKMLPDSPIRLQRIQELLAGSPVPPTLESLRALLEDEQNYPTAICRASSEKSSLATLFSITMNLSEGYARVKMGRPTEGGEELMLKP